MRLATIVGDPELAGDQADVSVALVANDVRLASDLSDYTGEVDLRPTFRLTDLDNGPDGPEAATVLDLQLSFRATCAATGDTTAGADCNLATTADSVIPGVIKESERMLMEGLDPVRVFDGGADGDLDTPADNTLFLTQGVLRSHDPLQLPASSRSRRCWSASDRSIIRAKKIANAITSTIDCSTIITTPPTLRSSSGERPQVRGTSAYAS